MALDTAVHKCQSGTMVFQDRDTGQVLLVPTRCRQWRCPRCSAGRYADARAKALAGEPERFITLTLRPMPGCSLPYQVAKIRSAFSRLVARVRRQFGTFEWMAALELTKAGTPHLHVLSRGSYISQRWLSNAWRKLTGAYMVDIRAVQQIPGAVAEVCKYLRKTAGQIEQHAPGVPVFTHSRHWLPEDFSDTSDPQGTWDFKCWLSISWSDLADLQHVLGFELKRTAQSDLARTIHWRAPPDPAQLEQLMSMGDYAEGSLACILEDAWERQQGHNPDLNDAIVKAEWIHSPTIYDPDPAEIPA